jgi:hypothetical protein
MAAAAAAAAAGAAGGSAVAAAAAPKDMVDDFFNDGPQWPPAQLTLPQSLKFCRKEFFKGDRPVISQVNSGFENLESKRVLSGQIEWGVGGANVVEMHCTLLQLQAWAAAVAKDRPLGEANVFSTQYQAIVGNIAAALTATRAPAAGAAAAAGLNAQRSTHAQFTVRMKYHRERKDLVEACVQFVSMAVALAQLYEAGEVVATPWEVLKLGRVKAAVDDSIRAAPGEPQDRRNPMNSIKP